MKFLDRRVAPILLAGAAMAFGTTGASALGWPSKYEGVMLQGFYWDSYEDTKWTNLEAQADELSQYFKLIWIPNSGKCSYMGYMPQYWFTNHNSAFGTESELLSMIQTYKEKGTGFIADCVINHRNGVTNWYDFPKEEWNGKTWSIGLDGICSNDEMAWAAGQPKPTGNYDTGDNFDGCRDLDHTNANVQDNCKNYVKCLIEKYGYAGMRYDMVKGYGGQYNKIYNTYANVEYSVGEYWDANYDAVAGWIEATGKTSAAFDFPCKYAINEAFSSGDMRKLVWKANGTTNQPAGMIHFGYARYSVTFIDNHDTYRDGSKFTGNVEAANAFILMSPGTPCVFLPHYQAHKSVIQKLIAVRNAAGINNESAVNVLRSDYDCYMAEVTGSKGKVAVKIGGAMVTPAGYGDSDIKVAGQDYCVWSKVGVDIPDNPDDPTVETPASLYLLGNLKGANWSTSASPAMQKSGEKFSITADFEAAKGETYCYFNLSDALAADWETLNAKANRFGASEEGVTVADGQTVKVNTYRKNVDASSAKSWKILPGTYTLTVDFKTMTMTIGKGTNEDNTDPSMPSAFYIIGHVDGNDWSYGAGVEMKKEGNLFTACVSLEQPSSATSDGYAYFSFVKRLGNSWDDLNESGNRFGPSADMEITVDGPEVSLIESAKPSQTKAYKVKEGHYDVTVDWKNRTVSVKRQVETGVENIENLDEEQRYRDVTYYDLQGNRVVRPIKGNLYIRVVGSKATKFLSR